MIQLIKRRAVALILPSLALAAVPAFSQQTWKPDGPVTIVVPYSPGGGTDALGRAVGKELSSIWGQPVIIENVPGADGLIGTRKVIGAKPDGQTLLLQTYAVTLAKHLPSANGFDPMPQLVPVSVFSQIPGVFVANPKLPGKTLAEVIRHCKTAAKPCSFATTESVARLHAQMLRADEGLHNLIVVNYKGGGQVITDLVAGNVDMAIMGITAAMPHYKSGALKVLATLGNKRTSVTPEVPSTAEAGLRSLDQVTWYGLFAPKGTPQNVVDAVAAATARAVKGEAATKTFSTLGAEVLETSSAESASITRKEIERMDGLAARFPLDK
ncbi:tripartite tricarboxylate transporter substrate binding protein [Ramlibacter henchirensis]|uniref:Tripartite tricarboxylate transporter substrate binding protein n=1 Tax=Ramlibacter henchirensis TaxID=204072 RepID=A0A4Z0BX21_9BURK|nr:tripartite tricarboxylate transporter substrate binding protein [Ramlibacter henchirensis]TFZ02900.1 tripartite tricarboxylate transporter substrate binding protein [Ramlibacter henchirensis]